MQSMEPRSSAVRPDGLYLDVLVWLQSHLFYRNTTEGCENSILIWFVQTEVSNYIDKGKLDMICGETGQLVFFWVGKNSVVLLPLEESGFAFLLLSFTSLAWFPKIFNQELFGTVAEEKEVKGIVSKVMEARKNKSYDSYEILGKFIGKGQVTKLILPLKEVRKVSQSLS